MAEQSIKLRICGKDYPFGIEPEKEELYRIAAREVNEMVSLLARNISEDEEYTAKDFLALTAFNFAKECIAMSQNREVGNEDVQELGAIADKIAAYMNRLSAE